MDTTFPVVDVERAHAGTLLARAHALDPGPDAFPEELAEAGAVAAGALPEPVLRALHQLGTGPAPGGVLLVRGLDADVEAAGLEATPSATQPPVLGARARVCRVALLAMLAPLGAPFTFASLYGGRLVQHVVPVPGREDAQTSEGSGSLLAPHVEDAFAEDRCDFFGLLCLRGHPDAATVFSRACDLRLPEVTAAVLREPRFCVEPDVAHGAEPPSADTAGAPCPVLIGPGEDPQIRYDALYQHAVPGDVAAAAALAALAQELERVAVARVLEPGDVLLVDNRRVVHGRTRFTARYDGTDRWLLRAMVTADRRAHRAAGSPRALQAVAR